MGALGFLVAPLSGGISPCLFNVKIWLLFKAIWETLGGSLKRRVVTQTAL